MIKLFLSDIDGCLAEPYEPYDLDAFRELSEYAKRSEESVRNGEISPLPRISLCSGRSLPYVEAMSQALGISTPVIFEGGGGLFERSGGRVRWHRGLTDDVLIELEQVRHWLVTSVLPGTSLNFDYGKRAHAGIIGTQKPEVTSVIPIVGEYVEAHTSFMTVYHTEYSIDVVPLELTKEAGIRWLAEDLSLTLSEVAYIGDSHMDFEALEAVSFAFSPSNAISRIQAVTRVMASSRIEGVLEAYRWCVRHNSDLIEQS